MNYTVVFDSKEAIDVEASSPAEAAEKAAKMDYYRSGEYDWGPCCNVRVTRCDGAQPPESFSVEVLQDPQFYARRRDG